MLFYRFALFALCLVLSAPCFSEVVGTMDAAHVQSDPRLQKPVTITAPRLYLGELLEQAGQQTGVRVFMDNHSLMSGTVVFAALRAQPLFETMNAIRSLLSYRKSEWEWMYFGNGAERYYCLMPKPSAPNITEIFKRQTHQAFVNHAKLLLSLAKLTPQERERHADEIAKSLLTDDKNAALTLLKTPDLWSSLRLFQDIATPEKQNDVLENGELETPFAALPETDKTLIRKRVKNEMVSYGSVIMRATIPQYVGFSISDVTAGGEFTPELWLKYIDKSNLGDNYRAVGVLGGQTLAKGIAAQINVEWLLDDDRTQDNVIEVQKIAAPTQPYPDGQMKASLQWIYPWSNQLTDSVALRLLQIAHESKFNILAHLPDNQYTEPGEPYGKDLRQTLNAMRGGSLHLMRKWRDNTLLIETPDWYTQTDRSVPYALFSHLRSMPTLSDGYTTVKMMNEALAATTTPQYYRLERDFQMLHLARSYADVFDFAARYPGVTSAEGLPVTEENLAVFTRLTGQYVGGDAVRLRGVWAGHLYFEYRTKTGAWETRFIFQN